MSILRILPGAARPRSTATGAPLLTASLALLVALPVADAQRASASVVTGAVVDATTGAPLGGAGIRAGDRRARTDAAGRFTVVVAARDTLHVTRLGYRAADLPASGRSPVEVRLVPVAVPLDVVRVAGSAAVARQAVRLDASEVTGGATAADLVAAMPFVAERSSPGGSVVSLRGARPEQVVVTLDGLPLNDPATGAADLSDIPLAALGGATAVGGADVLAAGSGASGGVLALRSGDATRVGMSMGSYGHRALDGAWRVPVAGGGVRVGGAWSRAVDDFLFRNVAAAPPADTVERRVNDDATRGALFASALLPRLQALALVSRVDRGLVGPMNVRAFDEDRGRTERALLRLAASPDEWSLTTGVRALANRYHDARRSDADARAWAVSGDAEAARAVGRLSARVGADIDRVGGTTLRARSRPRAFLAATGNAAPASRLVVTAGARVDAVRAAGVRLSPSIGAEWRAPVTLFARLGTAFRVPTFYDLYFASPQRVTARDLRPERVTLDAETGVRASAAVGGGWGVASADFSAFTRRTRDAIVWFPGNVGWSPTNVPTERVDGVEARTSLRVHAAELSAWGAAYRTRLRDGYQEMRTPYVPAADGGATLRVDAGATRLTTTLRAIGRRPFVNGPASPDLELGAATLLSASVVRRFSRLSAFLAGDDLGDVRWEPVRHYPTAGRTWSAGLTLQP